MKRRDYFEEICRRVDNDEDADHLDYQVLCNGVRLATVFENPKDKDCGYVPKNGNGYFRLMGLNDSHRRIKLNLTTIAKNKQVYLENPGTHKAAKNLVLHTFKKRRASFPYEHVVDASVVRPPALDQEILGTKVVWSDANKPKTNGVNKEELHNSVRILNEDLDEDFTIETLNVEDENSKAMESSTVDDKLIKSFVFLHLSDIHFCKGKSGGHYDLDEDVRNQLEIDAKKITNEIGKVNAILVTGDIAFSGSPDEYIKAKEWLINLKETLTSENSVILTVPGNHDVDQSIYKNEKLLRSTLDQILNCNTNDEINEFLSEIYSSPDAKTLIYKSIQNYNDFAEEFGCNINFNKQFWDHKFTLLNGTNIHIRGLNSTMGSRSGDEKSRNLFLGLKQVQVPTELNTLYFTLCHHPPEWLKDSDQIDDYLLDRVHIQLFGHKHIQRKIVTQNKIRLTAGAVHPSRKENNWIPRYNFIEIRSNNHGSVNVKVFPRVWKDTKFGTDYFETGKKYFEHHFELNAN